MHLHAFSFLIVNNIRNVTNGIVLTEFGIIPNLELEFQFQFERSPSFGIFRFFRPSRCSTIIYICCDIFSR
jgi:hypothetical protein